MSSKQLVLVPYDPAWPRLFQEEAERITASSMAGADACIAPLTSLGYAVAKGPFVRGVLAAPGA